MGISCETTKSLCKNNIMRNSSERLQKVTVQKNFKIPTCMNDQCWQSGTLVLYTVPGATEGRIGLEAMGNANFSSSLITKLTAASPVQKKTRTVLVTIHLVFKTFVH